MNIYGECINEAHSIPHILGKECTALRPDLATPSECEPSIPRHVIAQITQVLGEPIHKWSTVVSQTLSSVCSLTQQSRRHFLPALCLPPEYSEKLEQS